MSQIFHRSANTLSKVSIFGALFLIGGLIWLVAIWLVRGGAKRFTRDQLAASV